MEASVLVWESCIADQGTSEAAELKPIREQFALHELSGFPSPVHPYLSDKGIDMEDDELNSSPQRRWYVLPAYVASFPDKPHVPSCPECKTTKFVASLVDEKSATTSIVCCENGHSWWPSELVNLHLTDAIRAEEYSGEAAGQVLNIWVQQFWTEANGSTDRAFAILTGAILDELLNLMLSVFAIDEDLMQSRMLMSDRPLGTFGSRIDACYLFGLIRKNERQSLRLIQKIRNAFAHKLSNLSFEDDGISARIQTLMDGLNLNLKKSESRRIQFERCASTIWTSLLSKITLIKRSAKMPVDPSHSLLMRQISNHHNSQSS